MSHAVHLKKKKRKKRTMSQTTHKQPEEYELLLTTYHWLRYGGKLSFNAIISKQFFT